MKAVETIRRRSSPFWSDDDCCERKPAFRPDGSSIDNAFEWHLWQTIHLSMPVAENMIIKAITEHRKLDDIAGDDIRIGFNFRVEHDEQKFSDRPSGLQMVFICDIMRYE